MRKLVEPFAWCWVLWIAHGPELVAMTRRSLAWSGRRLRAVLRTRAAQYLIIRGLRDLDEGERKADGR